jgi:serine/threonine protein kinase
LFSELKLLKVIGGGGFGQVWSAKWKGTPVAVKGKLLSLYNMMTKLEDL